MEKTRRLILVGLAGAVLIAMGGWFYFGWYRAEKQVVARCHQRFVKPEGDYYKARDNFYRCLSSQGIEGFHGDGRFQWDKPAD